MIVGATLKSVNVTILLMLLIISIYFDLKERRIPNFLTFPVILWGLISACIFSGLDGAIFNGSGFLVGLAVFFIPFAFGAIGAGDVKLMAAIGALMGYKFVLNTAVITAVAGGIIVVVNSLINGTLYRVLKNISMFIVKGILFIAYKAFMNVNLYNKYKSINLQLSKQDKKYIPYAVAIGVGAVIVLSGQLEGKMPFR
jgi:prepilin peptidase CpaA